jgi:hypothetical protein
MLEVLNLRLKPAVTVAASRSVSVVRPDACSLLISEARAASVAVVAVQIAFPQEGCVEAANARSEEASAAVAQAHCGWAQAGYSAGLMADDLIPADCSAVLMADELILADYSALAGPSEQRCSLDVRLAEWPVAEPWHDLSEGYKSLRFVSPARPRGR